jgi:hypothetical protein
MRFEASLLIEGDIKEHYKMTKYGVSIIVDDSTLLINTGHFFCRDEILDALSCLFNEFYKKNPEAKIIAFGPKTSFAFSAPKHKERHNHIGRGVLGNANKIFNPLASPYLLRWYIHSIRNSMNDTIQAANLLTLETMTKKPSLRDIRKALRYTDFFYKAMIKADNEKVSLEKDFFKAWQLNLFKVAHYNSYGHMGLVNLGRLTQIFVKSDRLDYEEAFPPSQFIKVPRRMRVN